MLKQINLKSDFLKSVLLLTSGTVLAQIIHFGFQPIISRLFDTDEIGQLNIFLRIVTFFVSVGTLRYELSIPLPKKDTDAFQLFRVSLKIALYLIASFIIGGIIFALFSDKIGDELIYVLALSTVIFLSVFRNIGLNYAIRKKWFKSISYSKSIGALGMSLSKVGAGILSLGVPGLIAATVLGVFAGTMVYVKQFFKEKNRAENKASKELQKELVREHKDFPLMNLPHTLIDSGRELLIAVIFVEYFGKDNFGSYSFGLMIMGLPLALVGTTIGQAFFQKASELFNLNKPLFTLLKKTTLILAAISLVPFGVVYFFGEELFAWVFSSEWSYAGRLVEALTPWIALKFISSPISTIPLIIKKQRLFFVLGLINTALQLGILIWLPNLSRNISEEVLYLLSTLSMVMAIYLTIIVIVKLALVKSIDTQIAQK